MERAGGRSALVAVASVFGSMVAHLVTAAVIAAGVLLLLGYLLLATCSMLA